MYNFLTFSWMCKNEPKFVIKVYMFRLPELACLKVSTVGTLESHSYVLRVIRLISIKLYNLASFELLKYLKFLSGWGSPQTPASSY